MTVELFVPGRDYAEASRKAFADLSYYGGPLMDRPKIVGVFFDELNGSEYRLKAQMEAFLKWLVTSDVMASLAEYDEFGVHLESGSYLGSISLSLSTVPPPPPTGNCMQLAQALLECLEGSSSTKQLIRMSEEKYAISASVVLTDADVQSHLSKAISDGVVPFAPDGSTLYAMFFPTGVGVSIPPSDASCKTFCGYHDHFILSGASVQYAVLPFPDCTGCLGGLAELDALTSVTTHEVAEAVTDPVPGEGWYDETNGENGDICAWQTRKDAGFTVQLLWSNAHGACI